MKTNLWLGGLKAEVISKFFPESLPIVSIVMDSEHLHDFCTRRMSDVFSHAMKVSAVGPDDVLGLPVWDENKFVISAMQTSHSTPQLEHSIMVRQYEKYCIEPGEIEYVERLIVRYGAYTIDDFLKIHEAKFANDWNASHARTVFINRHKEYCKKTMTKVKICDCGAKHTSFQQVHYTWCKTQEK